MTPKTLILLIAATAVLVVGGLFYYESSAPPSETAVEGELLFPGLIDEVNDVASLEVATEEGQFTVQRGDEGWGLVERGGYPVLLERVRATLLALAEVKLVERKTENPALYERLGVQSVGEGTGAETPSKSVTAKRADGSVLAALIVGKSREAGTGATYYARRVGESASWLVEGERPPLPETGDEWLDKKVLELDRAEVRAGRTTHADGEVVTIAKKDSETDYTVLDVPEGRELKYASVAGGIAGSMQYLNFEEVLPVTEFEEPGPAVAVTELWTKDGMRVDARVFEGEDGKTWGLFHATLDLEGTPTLPQPTGPQPEAVAESVATPRPAAEVQAEIDALNARLDRWAYELPQYSRTNLTKRLEDLLKPLPTESEAPSAAPGDGGAALDLLEGSAPLEEEVEAPLLEDVELSDHNETPVDEQAQPTEEPAEEPLLEDAELSDHSETPVDEEP